MKTLVLHGDLAQFGGPYQFDAPSARAVVRGLAVQMPDLMKRMREGNFHVVHGDLSDGMELDDETVQMRLPDNEVHVVPSVEGAGDSGFTKIVAGAALIGLSFLPIGPVLAPVIGKAAAVGVASAVGGLGVSLALSGAAQLLAPTPSVDSNESPDRRPSFLFSGQINRTEPGNPVPLVFGRFRVGSVVASAGAAVEELPRSTDDGGSSKFLNGTL